MFNRLAVIVQTVALIWELVIISTVKMCIESISEDCYFVRQFTAVLFRSIIGILWTLLSIHTLPQKASQSI